VANDVTLLVLGAGLGVRHALDADHVVLVSTLVARSARLRSALWVAALWGAGHTLTFLGVGLCLTLAEVELPATFDRAAELAVGVMLIVAGGAHVRRGGAPAFASSAAPGSLLVRPVAAGFVHGLGGSSAVALLASTTASSQAAAAGYLCVVAAGTALGMVALTLLIARPLVFLSGRGERTRAACSRALGGLSVALGLWMIVVPSIY
jgi:nickel/cobalt transporter (NicO) family protein